MQARPPARLKAVQEEISVIHREVFKLKTECEELEQKIAALNAERGC